MAYQGQGYYPPPEQPGYPPQSGYSPQTGYAPQYQPQQQAASSNVVVVQQPAQPQTVVHVKDDKPNHILHAIITFFCWPWVFVWLLMCCIYGC